MNVIAAVMLAGEFVDGVDLSDGFANLNSFSAVAAFMVLTPLVALAALLATGKPLG